MSQCHYIKTGKNFNFKTLIEQVDQLNIEVISYKQRGDELFYFWVDDSSTRGVDVSIEEENWIEIRNTICSNRSDYALSNLLAKVICSEFDGTLFKENYEYDEDKNDSQEYLPIGEEPFSNIEQMKEIFENDCELVRLMVKQSGEALTLFSPIRKVYIGNRIIAENTKLSKVEFAKKLENLILMVNFNLPDWESGNILQMTRENEEKPLILKLITNNSPLIIEKFDFITFAPSEDDFLLISNDNLNKILPKDWTLVDEYTIVAPVISDEEFDQLIEKAREFDEKDVM